MIVATRDWCLPNVVMFSARRYGSGRVTAQLSTDRRRATTQLGRDRPHPKPSRCTSAMRTRSSSDNYRGETSRLRELITGG